ncbi:MAG TPA: alpha/beta hydrolase [Candidatus Dormibacteraeota bacterium]
MNRSRIATLLGITAVGGAAAVAALARVASAERRRLHDDPEYVELSRRVTGRPADVVSGDGTRIHAEVFGDVPSPTLVLLHGWTESLLFWHAQIVELSRDHRVVSVDLRGHGLSGSGEFSTDTLADDLSAVISACAAPGERVVLVGHSMGAMAIVAWAQRHPEELERAAGAVLVSTGMGDLVAEADLIPLPPALIRGRRLIGPYLITTPPVSPGWLAPVARRAVKYITLGNDASAAQVAFCHDVVMSCPRATWAGWGRVLVDLDLTEAVPSLDTPTLVMAGGSDRLTPPGHARRLAGALPRPAGLVVLDGAGHMLPVERADAVNTAVREFTAAHLRVPAATG